MATTEIGFDAMSVRLIFEPNPEFAEAETFLPNVQLPTRFKLFEGRQEVAQCVMVEP